MKVGDRVFHRTLDSFGTIDRIDRDGTHVTFEKQYRTRAGLLVNSKGIYDRRWFELRPDTLIPAEQANTPRAEPSNLPRGWSRDEHGNLTRTVGE